MMKVIFILPVKKKGHGTWPIVFMRNKDLSLKREKHRELCLLSFFMRMNVDLSLGRKGDMVLGLLSFYMKNVNLLD